MDDTTCNPYNSEKPHLHVAGCYRAGALAERALFQTELRRIMGFTDISAVRTLLHRLADDGPREVTS